MLQPREEFSLDIIAESQEKGNFARRRLFTGLCFALAWDLIKSGCLIAAAFLYPVCVFLCLAVQSGTL
jgi:hypothetical protein